MKTAKERELECLSCEHYNKNEGFCWKYSVPETYCYKLNPHRIKNKRFSEEEVRKARDKLMLYLFGNMTPINEARAKKIFNKELGLEK